MSRSNRILLAAAVVLAPAAPAAAKVSCTVSSPGVAFGNYNPRSAANFDGAGTVTVSCNQSASGITVTASGGASGNVNARRMTNGTSNLNYNLYIDSARTILFGTAPANKLNFSVSNSGSQSIYGRIPALQNVTAGNYSDSVLLTVTF